MTKFLDWPAIVFPSSAPADRVRRSQYRNGTLPTTRSLIRWAAEHGLRFVVDADGVRAERIRPNA